MVQFLSISLMDSLCQQHSDSNRIFSASICSKTRWRGSTSQTCLRKILTTIATVPPPVSAASPLFPDTQTKESSLSLTSADAGEGGLVSREINLDSGGGGERVETDEEHGNGVVLENPHSTHFEKTGGSLRVLIEAADLVFGELTAEIEGGGRKSRRRSGGSSTPELSGNFQGTKSSPVVRSPVVRSKRGRAQILPCKYRDSVLEPLTRLSKRR